MGLGSSCGATGTVAAVSPSSLTASHLSHPPTLRPSLEAWRRIVEASDLVVRKVTVWFWRSFFMKHRIT